MPVIVVMCRLTLRACGWDKLTVLTITYTIMKTILVPTDFSNNAFIAAQYAASLAQHTGQRLRLLHVFIALYVEEEKDKSLNDHLAGVSTEQMDELINTLRGQYPDVSIEGECVQGFMIDKLQEKLHAESYNLIVMGTKGATNLAESILGSTTFEVIRKSTVPVLVVPENTPDFKLDQVGFFTAYNDGELDTMLRLNHVLGTDFAVRVLHLYKSTTQDAVEENTQWEHKIRNAFPEGNFSFDTCRVVKINSNTVAEVAVAEKLDLLVFSRPHRTFFESIFAKSLTKEVASYPTVPSLFIRE